MKRTVKRKKGMPKTAPTSQLASHYNVTDDEIKAYNWERVLSNAERPDCAHYVTPLYSEANNRKDAGDERGQRVYRFLGSLASLHLAADNKDEPFGPMVQSSTGRSAVIDDYSAHELDTLEKILQEIRDADFRARVADVLWIRRKNHARATVAVKAYLESAARLEDADMWPRFVPQIERAVNIASSLGRSESLFAEAISVVSSFLDKHFESDKGLLSARLMETLLDHGQGNAVELAKRSAMLATRAETNKNWLFARTYW
ncbi:MAG: hypothetical protein M3N48_02120, partial [Verrucomicrobiota bacterium]|nr:hypothetical protein [Verrucomicrobiota bacterium]